MRNNFLAVERLLMSHGASLRRVTKTNPFGGYVAGYVVKDRQGVSEHWSNLSDILFHRVETTNPHSKL